MDALKQLEALKGTPQYDVLRRKLSESSVALWASENLTGPSNPPYNGKFLVGPHHIEWDQMAATERYIHVQAARDSGKSFFWTKALILHRAAHPQLMTKSLIYVFSRNQTLANEQLQDIKDEIETNPKLQWMLPKKKEQWAAKNIRLSNGVVIRARGFGVNVRGGHPGLIVCDDVLSDACIFSEVEREKDKDYFFGAISNMLIPGGQLIVVGTPFHAMDLYREIADRGVYKVRKYPARGPGGVPLWPARYDDDALKLKQQEVGAIRWSREFMCEPIMNEMSLFPDSLFHQDGVFVHNLKMGLPFEFWKRHGMDTFMGVDFAMSSSTGADYTVIFVLAQDQQGNRWVVDIIRGKGWAFQRQLNEIEHWARIYQPALVYLEANQMQRIFTEEVRRLTDVPVKPFHTGAQNKNDLTNGVPGMRILLENRKIKVPRGDEDAIYKTDVWIAEMTAFGWLQGKLQSTAQHDDTVMALWLANRACEDGGFSFSMGDEGGPEEDLDAEDKPIPMDPQYTGNWAAPPKEEMWPDAADMLGTAEDYGGNPVQDGETDHFGLGDPALNARMDRNGAPRQGSPSVASLLGLNEWDF